MVVVGETRERQVASDRLAAMLLGDDVIDLERHFIACLRHPAVFATVAGTLPDELGKSDFHGLTRHGRCA